jgi:hypothetical protein
MSVWLETCVQNFETGGNIKAYLELSILGKHGGLFAMTLCRWIQADNSTQLWAYAKPLGTQMLIKRVLLGLEHQLTSVWLKAGQNSSGILTYPPHLCHGK